MKNLCNFFNMRHIKLSLLLLVTLSFVWTLVIPIRANNFFEIGKVEFKFEPQTTQRAIRLGIAKPTLVSGNLAPESFADKLQYHFGNESSVKIFYYDRFFELSRIREQAAKDKCDYLLIIKISDNSERTTTDTIKGKIPFGLGKKKNYEVKTEYSIEEVKTGTEIFKGKADGKEKNKEAEKAIQEALQTLISTVTKTIKEHAAQNGLATLTDKDLVDESDASSDSTLSSKTKNANPSRLVVQTRHDQFVTSFSYSSDGNLLATLGADGVVKIWLVASGQEIISFPGYEIVGIDFSPDNKSVAGLSKDGIVRIFDLATGTYERLIPTRYDDGKSKGGGDDNPLISYSLFPQPVPIAFNKTGNLLVNGDLQGLKVWDIKSKSTIQNFQAGQDITRLALSNDGRYVAGVIEKGGHRENRIKLWSVETGTELKEFSPRLEVLTTIAFSKDDKLLLCASNNKSIKIYDVEAKTEVDKMVSKADESYGRELLANKIGDWVPFVGAVASIMSLIRYLRFKNESIRSVDLAPDNDTLAYNMGDGSIHILSLKTKKELKTIPEGVTAKDLEQESKFFRALCPISFSDDGRTINSCSEFRSILRYDVASGKALTELAVSRRGLNIVKDPLKKENYLTLSIPRATTARFVGEDKLLTATYAGGLRMWDLAKNSKPETLVYEDTLSVGNRTPVSADGRYFASLTNDDKSLLVRELRSRKEVRRFDANLKIISYSFSPDGRFIALQIAEEKKKWKFIPIFYINLKVVEITTGKEVYKSDKIWINQFDFSPDGKKFLVLPQEKTSFLEQYFLSSSILRANTNARILNTDTWTEITKIKVEQSLSTGFASKLVFSPDNKMVGGEDKDAMKIWDSTTGKKLFEKKLERNTEVSNLAFAPNRTLLTFSISKSLYNWDYGKDHITQFPIGTDFWGTLAYSQDGKVLALGGVESKVKLFNVDAEAETGNLLDPSGDEWMTVTPDGRFDSGELDDIKEVHWILPYALYKPQPVEAFMRFYYEPRLLGRIVDGEEFADVPNLSSLNITQPFVKIKDIRQTAPDTVSVTVDVMNMKSELQKDASGRPLESGVYDLRLFRNGQLVGYTTPTNKLSAFFEKSGMDAKQEQIFWRETNKVQLDSNGNKTIVFENIKIPQQVNIKQLEFSAYAFNEDRVKSATVKKTFDVPLTTASRKGRAYIITVGVNAFENPTFNLDFAANDARRTQEAVSSQLRASGNFEDVVSITLLSEQEMRGGKSVVTQKLATKDNVKKVLTSLSKGNKQTAISAPPVTPPKAEPTPKQPQKGKATPKKKTETQPIEQPKPTNPLAGIPNAEKLLTATPDDFVLILFSSHGYADRNGNFYIIPYDSGVGDKKVFTETVRNKSISSDDLTIWLRDVDAGEMVMIVDACHSAAAVTGKDFKPGPMGSKGLGQLSYDKGMKILAATQADNVARESKQLRQGLLSFALISDGLDSMQADFKPQDKLITMLEWLEYAVDRVPVIYQEEMDKTRDLVDESDAKPNGTSAPQGTSTTQTQKRKIKVQQPALFDFAKRKDETVLMKGK